MLPGYPLVSIMSLDRRRRCERCGTALTDGGLAYICSYERTFCERCAAAMDLLCPNCGGELVKRPRRQPKSPDPA